MVKEPTLEQQDYQQEMELLKLESPGLSDKERQIILKHRLGKLSNTFTVDFNKAAFAVSEEDKPADFREAYAERNCLVCSQLYTPKRYDSRTCSSKCSKEWVAQQSLIKWKSGTCKYCTKPGLPEYKSACADHIDHYRSLAKKSKRKLYDSRKSQGICVKCGKNPISKISTVYCGQCRTYSNMLRRIKRRAKKIRKDIMMT